MENKTMWLSEERRAEKTDSSKLSVLVRDLVGGGRERQREEKRAVTKGPRASCESSLRHPVQNWPVGPLRSAFVCA